MCMLRLCGVCSGYFTGTQAGCGAGLRELQEYVSFLARLFFWRSMSPPEDWPHSPVTPAQIEERLAREMSDVVRIG